MRQLPRLAALAALLTGLAAGAQESREYTVDPSASDIHWLVYKAGTLSKLGHNHVISVAELTGRVTVANDLAASKFELSFPVASLVVDDPRLRANLGEDFASVPTAEDKAGTQRNMLTDKVLDGEKFGTISVRGTGPSGAGGSQTLSVSVELLGRTVALTVPTKVVVNGDTLTASGEFELTHEALGMKPFSVMLGALQVADNMKFIYQVRAEASPAKH
jgi:polyisoprenoid-binding protein YceI